MIKANDVANYFIFKSSPGTVKSITNLKLQKLLYYAQGKYLARNNKPLFNDPIEAWKHGPVVAEVYRRFSSYIFNEIDKKNVNESDLNIVKRSRLDCFLDEVWTKYGEYNGKQLEIMTHQEKPWIETRGELPAYVSSTKKINEDVIKEYFKKTK